mmetsp:Transcript_19021/g.48581  ORF Transcript_19021/g.48581 Transcript_19021/m.48581 type:complete len:871 (-) Transcript_19021:1103-3715(-)
MSGLFSRCRQVLAFLPHHSFTPASRLLRANGGGARFFRSSLSSLSSRSRSTAHGKGGSSGHGAKKAKGQQADRVVGEGTVREKKWAGGNDSSEYMLERDGYSRLTAGARAATEQAENASTSAASTSRLAAIWRAGDYIVVHSNIWNEFLKSRGSSLTQVAIGFVIVGGASAYLFFDDAIDYASSKGAEVARSTVADKELQKKVHDATRIIVNALLQDQQLREQVVELVQHVLARPETADAVNRIATNVVYNVLQREDVQIFLMKKAQDIVYQLSLNPKTRQDLTNMFVYIIQTDAIRESATTLSKSVIAREDLVQQASASAWEVVKAAVGITPRKPSVITPDASIAMVPAATSPSLPVPSPPSSGPPPPSTQQQPPVPSQPSTSASSTPSSTSAPTSSSGTNSPTASTATTTSASPSSPTPAMKSAAGEESTSASPSVSPSFEHRQGEKRGGEGEGNGQTGVSAPSPTSPSGHEVGRNGEKEGEGEKKSGDTATDRAMNDKKSREVDSMDGMKRKKREEMEKKWREEEEKRREEQNRQKRKEEEDRMEMRREEMRRRRKEEREKKEKEEEERRRKIEEEEEKQRAAAKREEGEMAGWVGTLTSLWPWGRKEDSASSRREEEEAVRPTASKSAEVEVVRTPTLTQKERSALAMPLAPHPPAHPTAATSVLLPLQVKRSGVDIEKSAGVKFDMERSGEDVEVTGEEEEERGVESEVETKQEREEKEWSSESGEREEQSEDRMFEADNDNRTVYVVEDAVEVEEEPMLGREVDVGDITEEDLFLHSIGVDGQEEAEHTVEQVQPIHSSKVEGDESEKEKEIEVEVEVDGTAELEVEVEMDGSVEVEQADILVEEVKESGEEGEEEDRWEQSEE